MNETLKMKTDEKQSTHFGEVDMTVHYTLGAGLAEQLGDNVEHAVLAAISKLGGSSKKFQFENAMIRMETIWHCHLVEGFPFKRQSRALSLHLSNDREDNHSFSVDWDYF
jgi:hypothetical protein